MNQIFKAPTKLEGLDWTRTIFLAGSIDMGKADYWRKGNVDIVCQRYGIPTVSTLNELVSKCQKKLTP